MSRTSYISFAPIIGTSVEYRPFVAALAETTRHERIETLQSDTDTPHSILRISLLRHTHTDERFDREEPEPPISDQDGFEYWKGVKAYLRNQTFPSRYFGGSAESGGFYSRLILVEGHIWLLCKRGKSSYPPRLIIIDRDQRRRAINQAHRECGHRGRDPIYSHLRDMYYWPDMYADISSLIDACSPCRNRFLQHTDALMAEIPTRHFLMATTRMRPGRRGRRYLIQAQDVLSGWPEAEHTSDASHIATAKFIYGIVRRFGCVPVISGDYSVAFFGLVAEHLSARYGVTAIFRASVVLTNDQLQQFQTLRDALYVCAGDKEWEWPLYVQAVLVSMRVTSSTLTGYSPYFMVYGVLGTLAFDVDDITWRILQWSTIRDTVTLIAFRAQQVARIGHIGKQVQYHECLRRNRDISQRKNSLSFNFTCFPLGMWVLRHEISTDQENSKEEFLWRWSGPYIIHQRLQQGNDCFYMLRELDGTIMWGKVAARRLTILIHPPNNMFRTIAPEHFECRSRNALNELQTFYTQYLSHLLGGVKPGYDNDHQHMIPAVTYIPGPTIHNENPDH